MKTFKVGLILALSLLVLTVCFLEFKKQMDLKPQIVLVESSDWTLTPAQKREFKKINQAFTGNLELKTFVSEFTNVFKSLSRLTFIEDARWAWDHQQPFKIMAYVSKPKAMMFKNNDWYLVNDKGLVLKKVSKNQALDLPIFRSEELLKNDSLRQKSFEILKAFESSSSSIPIFAVSEVNKDNRGIFILLSEGFKVYMSDKKIEVQIQRLSNVIAYLKREKLNVEFIDTQSVQKILVRPKNKKD